MSSTWLLTIFVLSLKTSPLSSHRLITSSHPDREWDSIIVSSDPVTIREKSNNDTSLNEILRPRKRSYECPENDFGCLYGNDDGSKSANGIVDRFIQQYSHIADVKYSGETQPEEKDNSRKSYWSMVDSQTHNHPYDDKKGWVTLEPVPWSSSKISKWHPKGEAKPWEYASSTQRPVQQFWVSGSNYQPQMPSTHWGIGTNDIITDNKPSDFPSAHYPGYSHGSTNHPGNAAYGYQANHDRYQQPQEVPSRHPQNTHPSTYPSHGNGEWVLLSTTKGYSQPQRHRWAGQKDLKSSPVGRKIKPTDISKYQEEDLGEKYVLNGETLTGNRKSDIGGAEGSNETMETPVQVLFTGTPKDETPVATFRRKVRLQVLPALESSSTSYGGLLEVDSSPQTVDEAQQEDEKMQELKAIANVKKNRIRGFKIIPTSKITGKGLSHKNVMTLAAVGAGMIPATMALLVPMALGRRRRSLSKGTQKLHLD